RLAGRDRLPAWVVRIRSVLCLMVPRDRLGNANERLLDGVRLRQRDPLPASHVQGVALSKGRKPCSTEAQLVQSRSWRRCLRPSATLQRGTTASILIGRANGFAPRARAAWADSTRPSLRAACRKPR